MKSLKEITEDFWNLFSEKESEIRSLMDENKMGNHDYTDEMAQNMDHLNYKGAVQLTTRLDSLLKTLE